MQVILRTQAFFYQTLCRGGAVPPPSHISPRPKIHPSVLVQTHWHARTHTHAHTHKQKYSHLEDDGKHLHRDVKPMRRSHSGPGSTPPRGATRRGGRGRQSQEGRGCGDRYRGAPRPRRWARGVGHQGAAAGVGRVREGEDDTAVPP